MQNNKCKKRLAGVYGLILWLVACPLQAFSSVDEQIDSYLEVLERGGHTIKVQMLQRLQWSGLSHPRLYDAIEKQLLEHYRESEYNKQPLAILALQARALGYSGNEKYRATLAEVRQNAGHLKLRGHADTAIQQLPRFRDWQALIQASDYPVEGKAVEIGTYMRMLSVENPYVQRLAARAIFHERRQDAELLALAASRLESGYLDPQLSGATQDTLAWLCKALGHSGSLIYQDLLASVARDSPHDKIKKHAARYAQ